MKKLLLTILFVISFAASAFAEKQEYINYGYDFSKPKKICIVNWRGNNNVLDISMLESYNVLYEKAHKKLREPLTKVNSDYQVIFIEDIINYYQNQGTDLKYYLAHDKETYGRLVDKYVKNNVDIMVYVTLHVYGTGTEYEEGYWKTVPSTTTSDITMSNVYGGFASGTVTTYGTRQEYVPGKHVGTIWCTAYIDAVDVKTNYKVWSRLDYRKDVNRTKLQNTHPRDVYGRIVGSFFDDFQMKLLGKKTSSIKMFNMLKR